MKLTKTVVDRCSIPSPIPPANKCQVFLRDDAMRGFALRVTSGGVKTFILEKRIKGKVKRITLGRYPDLTAEQARRQAQKMLGEIAIGLDPVAKAKRERDESITLAEVFDDYLAARRSLKESTIHDYRRHLKSAFAQWRDKPLKQINKEMVVTLHGKLGEKSPARANNAMRVLRAMFNFAEGEYETEEGESLFPDNPVRRLSNARSWYKVPRRTSVIKAHDLEAWYIAVLSLGDDGQELARDYFLLILFTGLRRTEAASLPWSQIDFDERSLTVVDTKNGETHVLPLSDFLFDLLKQRRALTESPFVFPGTGKTGYLNNHNKPMAKVAERSGVAFTLHDLRRTFITIAEGLDIPAYALKRLLNHKMTNDVTAGYIISDIERLRGPMTLISNQLLSLCDH